MFMTPIDLTSQRLSKFELLNLNFLSGKIISQEKKLVTSKKLVTFH